MPFDQRSLINQEAWFPPCFVRQNQQKKNFFLRGDFRPLPNKNVQIWDHFFPLLLPKDSESLKILDIWLWEVGAKKLLNGTSKSEQTNKQTHTHMDKSTYRMHRPRGPMLWKSGIRETKNLSTDADSSTDTTVGWTKNTQKSNFFEKRKKSSKTQKLKNI